MRAARWLPVLWPLLVAMWATVALLCGVAHSDWVVAVTGSIGAAGGLIGAWLGWVLMQNDRTPRKGL